MQTEKTAVRPCPCCESSATVFQRRMGEDDLYECKECQSVYAATIPSGDLLSRTYDKLYSEAGSYQEHRDQVEEMKAARAGGPAVKIGWERKCFFQHAPRVSRDLLDIGCGTGFFLWAAKQHGWNPQGVELSTRAAELGIAVHGLPVQNVRIEEFKSGRKFGAITAWEVAEHIAQPHDFLEVVRGMIVPGGVFGGSIPNYARKRYRFGEDLGIASIPPVHLNYWTPESFTNTLKKAGFTGVMTIVPRVCADLLKPVRSLNAPRLKRFFSVMAGSDLPTTLFFLAKA